MKAMIVPGSVITKQTARDYLLRLAKMLQDNLSVESSFVLDEIEERIVASGFLSWDEIEAIEMEAML